MRPSVTLRHARPIQIPNPNPPSLPPVPPGYPRCASTLKYITQANTRPYANAPYKVPPFSVSPTAWSDTAWCTSIFNTGSPVTSESHRDPPVPTPSHYLDHLLDTAWSTSLVNTGHPFAHFSTSTLNNTSMSDSDYAAFLEKASADSKPSQSSQSKDTSSKITTVNTTQIHPALQSVKSQYVSDTDADFEPVSLHFEHAGKLNVKEFASMTTLEADQVEEVSTSSFDVHGDYKDVIIAVVKAADVKEKDVKVFRVQLQGARCEYWVVAPAKDNQVVGLKALAVES